MTTVKALELAAILAEKRLIDITTINVEPRFIDETQIEDSYESWFCRLINCATDKTLLFNQLEVYCIGHLDCLITDLPNYRMIYRTYHGEQTI